MIKMPISLYLLITVSRRCDACREWKPQAERPPSCCIPRAPAFSHFHLPHHNFELLPGCPSMATPPKLPLHRRVILFAGSIFTKMKTENGKSRGLRESDAWTLFPLWRPSQRRKTFILRSISKRPSLDSTCNGSLSICGVKGQVNR